MHVYVTYETDKTDLQNTMNILDRLDINFSKRNNIRNFFFHNIIPFNTTTR